MKSRLARLKDLPALISLEEKCFEPERQDGRSGFRRSLRSPHQEVWVIEDSDILVAAMILRFYPKTCRVYSIAVHPDAQGKGMGQKLLQLAAERSRKKGRLRLQLEVDARNIKLIQWYERNGYTPVKTLEDYYAKGWHGLRLQQILKDSF